MKRAPREAAEEAERERWLRDDQERENARYQAAIADEDRRRAEYLATDRAVTHAEWDEPLRMEDGSLPPSYRRLEADQRGALPDRPAPARRRRPLRQRLARLREDLAWRFLR